MLIKQWMTENVISVSPETSVLKAIKLMKDNNIGRLPVVDASMRVVGILSDRDTKQASPSNATSLDMHEVQYLLTELKVQEIMTKKPQCVASTDSVEKVAMLMECNNFGGMPVVEDEKLVGIITDHDIFKVFISITGARQNSLQLSFDLLDVPGALLGVLDILREHDANLISMLSHTENMGNIRRVLFRVHPLDSEEKELLLLDDLKKTYPGLHFERNVVIME